jgi:hypothetical protein
VIHAGPSAYSDLCPLSATRCGILYERGDTSPYEHITFARFSLAWADDTYVPPTQYAGDFDQDDDVDMEDFGHFQACITGPSYLVPIPEGCTDADVDGDGRVFDTDLATFVSCLSGAGLEPGPNCPRVPIDPGY